MANETIKARIQLKNDTEANWNKARRFVPLKGELIIYNCDEAHPFFRIKIGDGTTSVIDLPFIRADCVHEKVISHTTAYWNENREFIAPAGVILIYTDKDTIEKDGVEIEVPGFKVGDGSTYCVDLPFIDDYIWQVLNAHIENTEVHITQNERVKWNNKLNCNDEVINETLIFTRS